MALAPVPRTPLEPADDDHHIHLTDPDVIQDPDDGRMSFLEHLDELRKRLIAAVIAILVGFVISLAFIERTFDFIFQPLAIRTQTEFIATEPPELFMLRLKIGALVGLLLALPFVLWQFWLFISPGLYTHEKRFAIPFVFFGSVLFFAGAWFSHQIAFPWTFDFFAGYQTDYVRFTPKLGPTFSMYVKMLLAFGVVFQMPVIVFVLARMSVITPGFMVKNFKYALLIIFILGAVLSPGGDVVSQALLAGPMLVLYLISIGVAWIAAPRRPAADA